TTGGPYTGVCSSVSLDRATATDPDGDAMTYTWTSTNPNISFSPATGALARGAGTKPIPPSTVTLAGSVPPCGVTAPLTLTVLDTTKPMLLGVPADVTVECDAVPAPAVVKTTDNCDPAPVLGFAEVKTPGNCAGNYSLARTWTSTDRCTNTTSQTQTVTVEDTTPPGVVETNDDLYCVWP